MQDFRKLKVWQKSHELVLAAYRATVGFPQTEVYGLTSQTRRAASSIPANIAEGCGRSSDKDFARFLHISMGSACEFEYHLLLTRDLCYLPEDSYLDLSTRVSEVKMMLASFIKTLRR